jgi:hypothetical protein
MNDAGKFDDVVFEYIDGQGQRKHRVLQVKHKQDESNKIKVNDCSQKKTVNLVYKNTLSLNVRLNKTRAFQAVC